MLQLWDEQDKIHLAFAMSFGSSLIPTSSQSRTPHILLYTCTSETSTKHIKQCNQILLHQILTLGFSYCNL